MKNGKKLLFVVLMASVHFVSYAQTNEKNEHALLDEAKKAIAKSNAIYYQSTAKNDSSIFINSYTEDACILPPNAPMVCGRDAIGKFFRVGYNLGIRGGKFITTAVYGNGSEYVTEEGMGKVFDTEGNIFDEFKYLVLWKKTKNGWKMYRDAFSSNRDQK
jgi:ketosteroid isomerase-like protein